MSTIMPESIIFDLANYRENQSAHVEPGRYTLVVKDLEMTESKAGDPMIMVWTEIVEGPYAGMTIIDRLSQKATALFKTVAFLNALGVPTPKKRIKVSSAKIVGKRFIGVLEDNEFRGSVSSQIAAYERLAKKATPADDTADELPDTEAEDVSDEPTDYDEDAEPEKAEAAAAKKERKLQAAPEPEEAEDTTEAADGGDGDEVDLEELDL